ncbi:MAG: TerC/Alx family metal homeostasis membrane protein [Alphaproteobacteria bacterium]|nr:TerC/Alx family metal homeostasis membrane protein [Alphaproteobacteria bacterium]
MAPLWMWAVFFVVVFALLVFDLGILNKNDHEMGIRESLRMSAGYAFLAVLFGGWVWYELGPQQGSLFYTGYLVEQSLSLDNIFVISLVLNYFMIPRQYQHRVLFWGIIGVLALRGLMIGLGASIVAEVHQVLYFFAAFLVYTGAKMMFIEEDEEQDIENNAVLKFFKKRVHVTPQIHGNAFFVMQTDPETQKPARYFTPLMLALIVVECVDLIFAVDSIPAVLSITQDTFIVYTSNLFAIMGLRSLYFTLSVMLDRFKYLKYSLSLVLVFIGAKVFANGFIEPDPFPPVTSLLVTVGLLAGGVLFSLHRTKAELRKEVEEHGAAEKREDKEDKKDDEDADAA